MRRASCVPVLAVLVALTACDNPLGPVASLDLELTIQADNFVPGQAVPVTITLHNRTGRQIDVTNCALDVEAESPDGVIVDSVDVGRLQRSAISLSERPCADTTTVLPSDDAVFHGTWTGYGAAAASDSTVHVPLGTYRLRPVLTIYRRERGGTADLPPYLDPEFLDSQGGVLYGPAKPLPMVPWTGARFMHSYIGLPRVDLLVGGRLSVGSLDPGGLSYVTPVPAGTESVEIRAAGATAPLSTTSLDFSEGIVHTIVLRAGPRGPEPWDVTDTTAHPGPGQGALRVIHLAVASPDIEVYRTQPGSPDLVRIMTSFPYASASPYMVGQAGRWTIVVTTAGGTDTLFVAPVNLETGDVRTMLLLDDGKGGIIAPSILP